jgi:hypothetical protein
VICIGVASRYAVGLLQTIGKCAGLSAIALTLNGGLIALFRSQLVNMNAKSEDGMRMYFGNVFFFGSQSVCKSLLLLALHPAGLEPALVTKLKLAWARFGGLRFGQVLC